MGFAPAMMAIGAGLSGAAQVAGGMAAAEAGQYNATLKQNEAEYVRGATAADIAASRRRFDKFRGGFRADMAAIGGSASTGTGLDLAREAVVLAKLDELNISVSGENKARALDAGAAADRFEGKAARTQGIMGGLGTAMSGGARAYQVSQGY